MHASRGRELEDDKCTECEHTASLLPCALSCRLSSHAGRQIVGGQVVEGSSLSSLHTFRTLLCGQSSAKPRFCFASCFLGGVVHGALKGVCSTAGGMSERHSICLLWPTAAPPPDSLPPERRFFTPDHSVPGSSCGLQFSASSGAATSLRCQHQSVNTRFKGNCVPAPGGPLPHPKTPTPSPLPQAPEEITATCRDPGSVQNGAAPPHSWDHPIFFSLFLQPEGWRLSSPLKQRKNTFLYSVSSGWSKN